MRVTSTTISDSLVSQLNQLNSRQYRLQNQAATGQRVQWAADDPAAMRRALTAQEDQRANAQYGDNVAFLKDRSSVVVDALRGLQRVVDRAAELATAADGTASSDELRAYGRELDQLIRQGVELANARHQDDYVFGGTRSNEAPFAIQEDAAGNVSAVTYQGNTTVPALEIGRGVTVSVQVPGANASGTGPSGALSDPRSGADVFGHLIALRDHLLAGDTTAIAAQDRTALVRDEDHLIDQVATGAAVQARLESAATTITARSLALRQVLSQQTDADLAQTLVELSSTQTAYRAALQSGAQLLNTSLMDYLH